MDERQSAEEIVATVVDALRTQRRVEVYTGKALTRGPIKSYTGAFAKQDPDGILTILVDGSRNVECALKDIYTVTILE